MDLPPSRETPKVYTYTLIVYDAARLGHQWKTLGPQLTEAAKASRAAFYTRASDSSVVGVLASSYEKPSLCARLIKAFPWFKTANRWHKNYDVQRVEAAFDVVDEAWQANGQVEEVWSTDAGCVE
jgi:hypothetical protein